MKLADIREAVVSLAGQTARARLEADLGRRPAALLEPVYRAHEAALSPEAFALVREEEARAEGRRARRLHMLAEFLASSAEDAAARAPAEERAAREAAAAVPDPELGGALALAAAGERLARVADRDRRRALDGALREAFERTRSLSLAALEAAGETAARLGFSSYAQARAAVGDFDPAALAREAEAFLGATEAMYADVLAWWLRRTTGEKPFPNGAERHDWLHALHAAPYAGAFPAGADLPRALAGPLAAPGLAPDADRRIRFDGEDRPTKRPGAFAAVPEAGAEVVVAWRPARGADACAAFLHALGVAQHFANTGADRPFEDGACGDPTAALASGFLLENLLLDRAWLQRRLGVKDRDLARVTALSALARARQDAARLVCDLDLHAHGPGDAVLRRCAERLSEAVRARWSEETVLRETEPRFEAGRRLRARALEALLFEDLRERCNEDWWTNPAAGPRLLARFSAGRFETPEAVAQALGRGPADLARLARRLEEPLGAP